MSRLLVRNFSVSLDGYAAGPLQDLDHPLGIGGMQLHEWIFATRSGRQMIGEEGGSEGLDDDFFSERASGVGATIMGRNMFGPVRGPWGTSDWTGWWGEEPPFHHPVFVLTHQPRALSKCGVEQPFISLTVGLKRPSAQPSRRPVTWMSLSEVAQPPSGSTCVLRSSMKCIWR